MNPEDYSRDDLVTAAWPSLLACVVIAGFLWLISLKVRTRWTKSRWPVTAFGFLIASAGLWFSFQLLAKYCSLATSWSLVFLALLGGLAAEAIVWLYDFDKTLVSKKGGRILLALRLMALLTLLTIFLQPVRSFIEDRTIDREIAVLIDESDSMQLADHRLSIPEILDRAELFQVPTVRKRPPLHELQKIARALRRDFSEEMDAISAAPSVEAGLEARAEQLPAFFEKTTNQNKKLTETIASILKNSPSLPGSAKDRLTDYLKRSRDGIARVLPLAQKATESGNGKEVVKQLGVAIAELEGIFQTLSAVSQQADEAFINSLPQNQRDELNKTRDRPRVQIAKQALDGPIFPTTKEGIVSDLTLLGRLKESYNLRVYRFARDVEEVSRLEEITEPTEGPHPEKSQTDLSTALEYVLENTSPESLAGVLLLSDGRHNAGIIPEDSLRQLAVQNSPLSIIPIGGHLGPIDISLLSLGAPESIYLDDRVVVKATAKLDGLLGKKVKAELLSDGKVIEEQVIEVSDVSYRTEIRFVHTPEEKGILDYEVRLEPDEREIFKDNNSWDFKVAITDDRTNVLLVDSYPRWEFRYLRNLFYGRDKSVHLQYVLLNPDEIENSSAPQSVAASVTRKFGDAEANRLPANPQEWGLFDVIILGDIAPTSISVREWRAIEEAVSKRGAMLVCVAGQRHMPHAHNNQILTKLLPITYEPSSDWKPTTPDQSFRIALSSVGRNHPVTSQSTSRSLNAERWVSFPPISWRFEGNGVKEGAEVLAFAQANGSSGIGTPNINPNGSPDSVEAAIKQLANQKTYEAENALITTQRVGLGKVLMMNFDQTWRFRYGVGDTYHHRFWGQVTRWGSGENLRAGNEEVRIGTDRLSYTPSDAVTVTAKVLDEDHRPVTDTTIYADVFLGETRVIRQKMTYVPDSSGIYKTQVTGLSTEGEYIVRLEGKAVEKAVANNPEGPSNISTELVVLNSRNPIELAELTADRDFLNRATRMTNGKMAELWDLETLFSAFGAKKETLTERRNVTLWDKWPLLVLFLGLLLTEWVLRRRSGLV